MIFHDERVRDLFDMRIFVDTDSDTRLSRRGSCVISMTLLPVNRPDSTVLRDMESRGRSLESILDQYEKFVQPSFNKHIWPVLILIMHTRVLTLPDEKICAHDHPTRR